MRQNPTVDEILALRVRVDSLERALEEIADPLTAMRKRAEAEGGRLSGMAYQIANDVNYIKGIARRALVEPGEPQT